MIRFVYLLTGFLIFSTEAQSKCSVPKGKLYTAKRISGKQLKDYSSDTKRYYNSIQNMCVYDINFKENKYNWKMLLIVNLNKPKGAFWFLPHDNENTAFGAAVYASKKYGGGFLAVNSGGKRFFKGQDPNRNFGDTVQTAKICRGQKNAAPKYAKVIFSIIDKYKSSNMPYLALHNNANGYSGNGGRGGISILKSSSIIRSYPASKGITKNSKGIKDEDSLVYIAGKNSVPNKHKLGALLNQGINVKYEWIDNSRNDCSMSNYVILKKKTTKYYNIETEHGDISTQKIMIDRLMGII